MARGGMIPNNLADGNHLPPVSFAPCSGQALHCSEAEPKLLLQEAAGRFGGWLPLTTLTEHAAWVPLYTQPQGGHGDPESRVETKRLP